MRAVGSSTVDPYAKIAEFKISAVRIEPAVATAAV